PGSRRSRRGPCTRGRESGRCPASRPSRRTRGTASRSWTGRGHPAPPRRPPPPRARRIGLDRGGRLDALQRVVERKPDVNLEVVPPPAALPLLLSAAAAAEQGAEDGAEMAGG